MPAAPCGKGSGDRCCGKLLRGVAEARRIVLGYREPRYARGYGGHGSTGISPGSSHSKSSGTNSPSSSSSSSSMRSREAAAAGSGGGAFLFGTDASQGRLHASPSLAGLVFGVPWRRVWARHGTKAKCGSLRAWGRVAEATVEARRAARVGFGRAVLAWVPPLTRAVHGAAASAPAAQMPLAAQVNVAATPTGDASDALAAASGAPIFSLQGCFANGALGTAYFWACRAGAGAGAVAGRLLAAILPNKLREMLRSAAEQLLEGEDEVLR
jgi:hypothetical protein